MLEQIVKDTLQEQFNHERYNAAVYRSLAFGLEVVNWPGAAKWMRAASDEEQAHADKFAEYLIARNVTPVLSVLPSPERVLGDDMVAYFSAALELEKANTEKIVQLKMISEQNEDPQTCVFLIWALEEQTQAEREINDILVTLRRLDNNGRQVFDHELEG